MRNRSIKSVAILGGGPAGAALATLLAKRNYRVGLFHTAKRPPLIVGESLIPALIPILRELGIEEEVKSFSTYKPGATVCLAVDEIVSSYFTNARGRLPCYAYNTPRDLFDAAVLNAAEKAGARIFNCMAKLRRGPAPDTAELTPETLQSTDGFFADPPDLIVDAGGRLRLIAKLLGVPDRVGQRDDIALFAHLDHAVMTDVGNIHLDHLTKGWSWRIPLPGKVSLGIVIKSAHLASYGQTIEEQYDNFITQEPSLRVYTQGSKRLTPVVRYSNYQLVSERMFGPGWMMVGDSAAFLDPIFSSGLYLAMKSAFEAAKAIERSSPAAMRRYERNLSWELRRWQRVIDTWYDGRLFNLYRAGQNIKDTLLGRRMSGRVQMRLGRIFSGEAVTERVGMLLFDYLISFGKVLRNPSDLVVD